MNDQLNAMMSASSNTPTTPAAPTIDPQVQAMLNAGLTPDQSKTALGHSNSLLLNSLKNVAAGASKETITTLGNLGTGIEKGLDATANLIPGVHANTAASSAVTSANPSLQPQGLGEKIGAAGASVGQLLTPGGAEAGLAEKAAPALESLPGILGVTGKAASAVTGALKTALKGVIGAGSFGAVTAAQTGDMKQAEGAAKLGAVGGGLSGALETFGKGLGESLQKADFKLSPAQEAKASSKVDSAAKFMTENKILGSDSSKFSKLTQLNSSLEGALQSSLPDTLKVSKSSVIDNINTTIESLRSEDPAIYEPARASADKAINLMKSTSGDEISLKDTLNAKRSYGSAAFKQSKFSAKDPTVVSEGSFAVEQGLQKALEDKLGAQGFSAPGLGSNQAAKIKIPNTLSQYFNGAKEVSLPDFNKVYSNAISSKQLTSMARFKNDSGLLGRFFGLWVGESIGQAVSPGLGGKLVGATIGEIASQKVPGIARNLGERVVAHPNVPENLAKAAQGIENQ